MNHFDAVRAIVLDTLRRSHHAAMAGENLGAWSLQGFGMLRLYFGKRWRLHVWDQRAAYPRVSTIHDHLQWDFESLILSGRIVNQRFFMVDEPHGEPYRYMRIQTGTGGFGLEDAAWCRLWARGPETYLVGETYRQRADEVHESRPDDGTVTLVEREHTGHGDVARVFWRPGAEWVTAEPRPATPAEIRDVVGLALERW